MPIKVTLMDGWERGREKAKEIVLYSGQKIVVTPDSLKNLEFEAENIQARLGLSIGHIHLNVEEDRLILHNDGRSTDIRCWCGGRPVITPCPVEIRPSKTLHHLQVGELDLWFQLSIE